MQVSSADFGFTYRTFSTVREPAEEGTRELYAKIRRFRELDPKTFVIELREPFADWRAFFDVVLPRHALTGENITAIWRNRIDNPKTGRPIGNGPFLVSRLETGRRLILIRNPNYWGPHTAHLDRQITALPEYDPADPLGPLRRNEIDFTATPPGFPGQLTAELAAEARRIPGWRVVAWSSLSKEHLVFRVDRGGHPALRNKARPAGTCVRDRPGGRSRAGSMRISVRARGRSTARSFSPTSRSYRPNWSVYRYDPGRARRLLEQAGCRRGADAVYSCAGERMRLRFFTTAGNAGASWRLRLMRTQLRRAGVEIEPVYAPRPRPLRHDPAERRFRCRPVLLGREPGRQPDARDEMRGFAELGRVLQPAGDARLPTGGPDPRSGAPCPRSRRRRPEGRGRRACAARSSRA